MGNTVAFGPFVLDLVSGELHSAAGRILPQQKVFRALALFVERPGEVISRETLSWALWPDGEIVDFEHGVNTVMKRLRDLLHDSAASPRFIETVPRRGYRFIAEVDRPSLASTADPSRILVGRERELDSLHQAFARAERGLVQCVFVSGEAGIGKTALIQRFMNAIGPGAQNAEGRCVASYGPDDPFGPVLDALRRLGVAHAHLAGIVARHAPSWMPHLPSLAARGGFAASRAAISSATRPRMLREIAAALEAASVERPVVLSLEDLQWADESSLALVQKLAEARHARLLVLCTFRPAVRGRVDVLDHELGLKRIAVRLPLRGLPPDAVLEFLRVRWPRLSQPGPLARALHARTEGNPLFLTACVDALQQQGIAGEQGPVKALVTLDTVRTILPPTLIELVHVQLSRLPLLHQQVLTTASLAGSTFTARLLAQITGLDLRQLREVLDSLERRKEFIERRNGPDARDRDGGDEYAFTHVLYADALQDRLTSEAAADVHGRLADALMGEDTGGRAMATELAMHLDRAGRLEQSVGMYVKAADVALTRTAHGEATRHARRGLQLLELLPEGIHRDESEIALQLRLGAAVSWTHGFGDAAVLAAFARAADLCGRLPDSRQLVPALLGLNRFYGSVGPIAEAVALGQRALDHCRRFGDAGMLLEAIQHCATVEFFEGRFVAAERKVVEVENMIEAREREGATVALYFTGLDGRTVCLIMRCDMLWFLGRFNESTATADELRRRLTRIEHVDTLGCALAWLAVHESMSGECRRAFVHAEAAVRLARDREDAIQYRPFALLALGREHARRGDLEAGTALIEEGLATVLPSWYPIGYALLADAFASAHAWHDALKAAQRGLDESAKRGMQYNDAELLRLRGLALAALNGPQDPAAWESLTRAAAVAQAQESRWLELRALIALCSVGHRESKTRISQLRRLAAVLDGQDSADLRAARSVLAAEPRGDATRRSAGSRGLGR